MSRLVAKVWLDVAAVGLSSTFDYLAASSLFLEADSHFTAASAESGQGQIKILYLLQDAEDMCVKVLRY